MSDIDRFTRFLLEAAAHYHDPPATPCEAMWASIEGGGAGTAAEEAPDDEVALVSAAASYHTPPVTPHEDMWRRIAPAWELRRARLVPVAPPEGGGEGGVRVGHHRFVTRWLPAIAAASLVVGVAIGRTSIRCPSAAPPAAATGPSASDEESRVATAREVALRYVTVRHLGQAETLLAAFRADADESEQVVDVSHWARELLGDTRLLIDTPGARTSRERALLEELELVLAQIAALGPESPTFERAMVANEIERQGTLARLQAVASPGDIGLEGLTEPWMR